MNGFQGMQNIQELDLTQLFQLAQTSLPCFARWCISVSPQFLTQVRGTVTMMMTQR